MKSGCGMRFSRRRRLIAIAPGQQQIGHQWLPALAITYTPGA
jgi:hypothetical protein